MNVHDLGSRIGDWLLSAQNAFGPSTRRNSSLSPDAAAFASSELHSWTRGARGGRAPPYTRSPAVIRILASLIQFYPHHTEPAGAGDSRVGVDVVVYDRPPLRLGVSARHRTLVLQRGVSLEVTGVGA